MKDRLLIVEEWDITVDDDYVNSLDSKINDVKNKIRISNDDSEDDSNEQNFSLIDKSDTHDNNLTLRLKEVCKRQLEQLVYRGRIIYFHLHSQLENNKGIKTCHVLFTIDY